MAAERPLSVLLVCPESTGGIGRHVRMLAEGLLARGQRVTICAPEPTVQRLALRDVPAATVEALPVGDIAAALRLHRRLRRLAAAHDVVHAHGVRVGAQLAVAAPGALVTTWHNAPLGSARRQRVHRALELVSARRSALVLGASADLVARARSAGARAARLCAVAAPAGGVGPPAARSTALHSPPTVLAVGRLHAQKRFDVLIDATPAVAEQIDGGLRVLIAGDGPLRDRLIRRAHDLGAPVTFLGARSDVDTLMTQADVVVLASDWEARPLVAQEALRAGVPLVATDVGGVRDLVGEAGVLVQPADPAALAAGLLRVLEDEDLRRRLRDAGPARAAGWPTVDQMVDLILSEYLEVRSTSRL